MNKSDRIIIPTVQGDRRQRTYATYIGPDPDNEGYHLVWTDKPVHGEHLHSLPMADIKASDYTSGPVGLDGLAIVLGQYDPRERWNGWLCPSFDAHGVQTVLEALASEPHDDPDVFEWQDDLSLKITQPTEDPDYVDYLHPDSDGLYALGNYSWTWSEHEMPADGKVVLDGIVLRIDNDVIGWMDDWGAVYEKHWLDRGLVETEDHNSGGLGGFSYRLTNKGKATLQDYTHFRINDDRRTLDDLELAVLVVRVKAEVLEDMGRAVSSRSLVMPHTVGIPRYAKKRGHPEGGYSELHDYVDANYYGGACEDNSTLTMGDVIAMQDVIHQWLITGQAFADKEAQIKEA